MKFFREFIGCQKFVKIISTFDQQFTCRRCFCWHKSFYSSPKMLVILDVIDNHFIFFCLLLIKGGWPPFLQHCQCCQLTFLNLQCSVCSSTNSSMEKQENISWNQFEKQNFVKVIFTIILLQGGYKKCDFTKYFPCALWKLIVGNTVCYNFLYSWESICYIKNFSEFM